MTYGLHCAHSCPEISQIVINDFYVDDLLTGTQAVSEIAKIKVDLWRIFAQAGMELGKWATNCPDIQELANRSKEIITDKNPKTLGLLWLQTRHTDELRFPITPSHSNRITKRIILSEIAQIFDLLGLISLIITTAKLILQQLWQIQSCWDQLVSQELYTQ
ncbi:uncharacterized protein LOC143432227 [Xylocopa sonorina]|uniref:uncharacterized protein LOC143423836 n=1 Tax=Xylocopa sonorina TaxID=1818115 RepID=UPI00403ABAAA